MILIGRYLSPFVRRVGTVLEHYGIEFEHRPLRAGGEEQDIVRQSSPLGRVPAGQIFVLLRVVSERSMARDGCSS